MLIAINLIIIVLMLVLAKSEKLNDIENFPTFLFFCLTVIDFWLVISKLMKLDKTLVICFLCFIIPSILILFLCSDEKVRNIGKLLLSAVITSIIVYYSLFLITCGIIR